MKMRVILDSDDVLFPCNEVAVDHLNKAEGTAYTLNDIKNGDFWEISWINDFPILRILHLFVTCSLIGTRRCLWQSWQKWPKYLLQQALILFVLENG